MSQQTHENTGQLIRTIAHRLNGNSTIEQDTEISSLMADNWQVINVTINSIYSEYDNYPSEWHTRYTTLVKYTPVKS